VDSGTATLKGETILRRFLATLAVAATLSGPILVGPAETLAANNTAVDNLVNVQVGDVTVLQNANPLNNNDVAALVNVVAQVCGTDVNVDVLALAQQVDATGRKATVCKSAQGPLTIRQNR
jgi:hypothetical protein